MSKRLEENWDVDLSRDTSGLGDEKSAFFVPSTKLNETAMIEYGLKRPGIGDRKQSGSDMPGKMFQKSDPAFDQNFLLNDDEEFLERFDSRGKKMKLRRGIVAHPALHRTAQSYAQVNFHPSTYITQKDLKQRATSVVYGKYKQIKRELALIEQ